MNSNPQTFTLKAIKKNGAFDYFGIHPMTASLYGVNPDDIIQVECTIVDHTDRSGADPYYWGWLDSEGDLSGHFIYKRYFLVDMCFPDGIKGAESKNRGRAVALEVKEINGTTN